MRKKTTRWGSDRTSGISRGDKNYLSQWGFSFIEILFTLVISSILLGLAFPIFNSLIVGLCLFILTERMNSTLDYAQNEAIRRQNVITLCKSKDGQTCSGTWREGWIVFVNHSTTSFQNKELLHVYPALLGNEFLEWHGFRSDDYLQLYPDGSMSQNGSFIVCIHSLSKKMVWLIQISQTGRKRIDKENAQERDCN